LQDADARLTRASIWRHWHQT